MNLWETIQSTFKPDQLRVVENLGRIAQRKNTGLFLVGGAVRDLLMGRTQASPDLDLVVEGDAILFAHAVSAESGAGLTVHKQFGTATLSFENSLSVDLATARTETYKKPGALPRVAPAQSIADDLLRRDFSINAMAVNVSADRPGELTDPHHGFEDLESGLLRVLHRQSFMDDPTRILRGVRFQARFDFGFEYETRGLLHAALDSEVLHRVSGARLRKEIQACFEESARVPIINELNGLNIDSGALAPGLTFHTRWLEPEDCVAHALRVLCTGEDPPAPQEWIVYLMAAADGAGDETMLNLARRIALSRKQAAPLLNPLYYAYDARARLEDLETGAAEVEELLAGAEDEVLVYLHATAAEDSVRGRITQYVHATRSVRLEISGSDLLGMGHEPSPMFARVLREVRRSKIQGKVKNRRQELDLARKLLNAWD